MNTEQQRAAFEAWASKQGRYGSADCPVDYRRGVTRDAEKVWQAAFESPQIQDLKDALQSILYDMEVEGRGTGYEYQNAQAVLAAMEKQK